MLRLKLVLFQMKQYTSGGSRILCWEGQKSYHMTIFFNFLQKLRAKREIVYCITSAENDICISIEGESYHTSEASVVFARNGNSFLHIIMFHTIFFIISALKNQHISKFKTLLKIIHFRRVIKRSVENVHFLH